MRHREQRPAPAAGQRQRAQARVRAAVIARAHGAEERPVRGRVRYPQQRPVQRPRLQRPGLPDGDGTGAALPLVLPPGRAQHQVPQFLQRPRAEGIAPVRAGPHRRRLPRPCPRHQRQVPGQRGDDILNPGLRHQRHQHEHPDHEGPGQKPFPLPLHEPGTQRRPPGDPADDARPGLLLQRPQRRVMHRTALRTDLPVPLDLRLRDRDHLAEHDRAARADLLRPPDHQRGPVPAPQVPAALQRPRQQLQRHRDHHPARNRHGTRRDRVRRRHVRLRRRSGT